VPTPRPTFPRLSCSLDRPLDEAYFDEDDDDWIFSPMIDEILNESRKRHYDEALLDDEEEDLQYGGGVIQPVGALRNWKHVPNK